MKKITKKQCEIIQFEKYFPVLKREVILLKIITFLLKIFFSLKISYFPKYKTNAGKYRIFSKKSSKCIKKFRVQTKKFEKHFSKKYF